MFSAVANAHSARPVGRGLLFALSFVGLLIGQVNGALSIPTAAAAGVPKMVVIVGPTHEMTDSNLASGEEAAALGESLGFNVVRVFHPHATWDQVVAATQGANIVVYMGHGSGWHGPGSDADPRWKFGFGLDKYDGAGPSEVKYWGATYVREQLHFAPGAFVILNHLCYASGLSSPGDPDPTREVAMERVDYFGTGFLAAGASAVLAYSNGSIDTVLMALAGDQSQTLDQVFMSTDFVGLDDFYFNGSHSAGAVAHMDPSDPSSYYRSIIGKLDTTVGDVLGGTFTEPAPQFVSASVSPVFSPNGDRRLEKATVKFALARAANWTLSIQNSADATVFSTSGAGSNVNFQWTGRDGAGVAQPDGSYRVVLAASNAAATAYLDAGTTVLDLTKPVLSQLNANGGGTFSFTSSEAGKVKFIVRNLQGSVVNTWQAPVTAGPNQTAWNGMTKSGATAPVGTYRLYAQPQDGAGIRGTTVRLTFAVIP
jgi:flagellar hook assembly protein FlgD